MTVQPFSLTTTDPYSHILTPPPSPLPPLSLPPSPTSTPTITTAVTSNSNTNTSSSTSSSMSLSSTCNPEYVQSVIVSGTSKTSREIFEQFSLVQILYPGEERS
ncbi:hypothetical protein HZH66_000164 [Vespula vulgaris]|uniref:Uncharacterized protein n=1 Tax=Vespula vulgaris TaxID=7454 RepID=A0A834KQU2_VESVU|nr:hypothetical protein HZH66_000164 [Vespula vulgaris]